MNKRILIISLILLISISWAQDKRIAFSAGVSYQQQWTGEFTMMYANYDMAP